MTFELGQDEKTELTERQVLEQCRMYVAAMRIADEFGCALIGIQYQQGLKDLMPASDLAEGLLNNVERPPVRYAEGAQRELYAGRRAAALQRGGRVRRRRRPGHQRPVEEARLLARDHAARRALGRAYQGEGIDDFVWVLEISGAVPPAHLEGGYRGRRSERQPPMYFPLGGGTIKGVSQARRGGLEPRLRREGPAPLRHRAWAGRWPCRRRGDRGALAPHHTRSGRS